MTLSHEQEYQNSWQERQDYAENMQPIIGRLYRNKGVEIAVYGRPQDCGTFRRKQTTLT